MFFAVTDVVSERNGRDGAGNCGLTGSGGLTLLFRYTLLGFGGSDVGLGGMAGFASSESVVDEEVFGDAAESGGGLLGNGGRCFSVVVVVVAAAAIAVGDNGDVVGDVANVKGSAPDDGLEGSAGLGGDPPIPDAGRIDDGRIDPGGGFEGRAGFRRAV